MFNYFLTVSAECFVFFPPKYKIVGDHESVLGRCSGCVHLIKLFHHLKTTLQLPIFYVVFTFFVLLIT